MVLKLGLAFMAGGWTTRNSVDLYEGVHGRQKKMKR